MAHVVRNACFGGFSLSRAAVLRARELSGNPQWGGPTIKGDAADGWTCDRDYGYLDGIARHDAVLVAVVREMGTDANGDCADLRIEDVGTSPYRIDEYDGRETVVTPDGYDWINPNS